MTKAQEYINQQYPTKEEREKIIELGIVSKNLQGELDLSDFINLEELYCENNELTNLILPSSLISLHCRNNPLTGSLDQLLTNLKQLEELDIINTDFNEVKTDKLPKSLRTIIIEYSTDKGLGCKLNTVVPLLKEHFGEFGRCLECQQFDDSYGWCQLCNSQHFRNNFKNWTSGNQEIDKFIQKCQLEATSSFDVLEWIPYKKFTDLKYLARGGFGEVYKAKWTDKSIAKWDVKENNWKRKNIYGSGERIVLKELHNSKNITNDFLQEIDNHRIPNDFHIVHCFGISQNPQTKNYVMVMQYIKGGNLREYLQNNYNELDFYSKLVKLLSVAEGLDYIHKVGLIHRDFHAGNILGSSEASWGRVEGFTITDLGLCRPVNEDNDEKVYGQIPYMAPEVLQGKSYTEVSDVYAFGIVAYELLTNTYPYPKMDDMNLILAVCNGLRPNIDRIPLPQELKDLIKRCWDANHENRPSAEELEKTLSDWYYEIRDKKNTEFYQQYQAIKDEYNRFSKNTPYQIHPTATAYSKMVDTNEITKRLKTMEYPNSQMIDVENLLVGTKRQLSLSSQNEPLPQNKKSTGITGLLEKTNIEEKEFQTEPMEIDDNQFSQQIDIENLNLENKDWTSIHGDFKNETLTQNWQNLNFTHQQTQDWINIGLQPNDYNFCAWLRDNKHFTPEQVLNHENKEQLNQEFSNWQEQQQTQIEQPPK